MFDSHRTMTANASLSAAADTVEQLDLAAPGDALTKQRGAAARLEEASGQLQQDAATAEAAAVEAMHAGDLDAARAAATTRDSSRAALDILADNELADDATQEANGALARFLVDARPAISAAFDDAADALAAAHKRAGSGAVSPAKLINAKGGAATWQALTSAAARLDTLAGVLDTLRKHARGQRLDSRHDVATRYAANLATPTAAEDYASANAWLQSAEVAPLRKWLSILNAKGRNGTAPTLRALSVSEQRQECEQFDKASDAAAAS